MQNGQFYTVSTPIGNLKDISYRAIEVLSSVDFIACEDKRVSSVLLSAFNISKPLIVYQKHNEQEASQKIISLIDEGKSVALISDAGTPCVSDPGKIIVKKLFENSVKTINIPGASAITTILASSPRDDESFAFCGFLPRTRPSLEKLLDKFKNIDLIFYESPNRLLETLKFILKIRGKTQKITIGRELTKKFEEIIYESVPGALDYFTKNTLKGEIVGILYKTPDCEQNNYDNEIKKLLNQGFSSKDISIILSELYNTSKKEIYSRAVKFKIT